MPYTWGQALRFPGANDAAFAKWIFENLSEYKFEAICLENRHILHPFVSYSENKTVICRTNINEDVL